MESNSMQDLADAVSAALAYTMAAQQVQSRLNDAMLIAINEALPPLIPAIRHHFSELTAAVPAGMDQAATDHFRETADLWMRKLDSLAQ